MRVRVWAAPYKVPNNKFSRFTQLGSFLTFRSRCIFFTTIFPIELTRYQKSIVLWSELNKVCDGNVLREVSFKRRWTIVSCVIWTWLLSSRCQEGPCGNPTTRLSKVMKVVTRNQASDHPQAGPSTNTATVCSGGWRCCHEQTEDIPTKGTNYFSCLNLYFTTRCKGVSIHVACDWGFRNWRKYPQHLCVKRGNNLLILENTDL